MVMYTNNGYIVFENSNGKLVFTSSSKDVSTAIKEVISSGVEASIQLTGERLRGVDLAGMRINSTIALSQSVVENINLRNTRITDFVLQSSILRNCNFEGCVIERVNIQRCKIEECNFKDTTFISGTINGCKIENKNINNGMAAAYSLEAVFLDNIVYAVPKFKPIYSLSKVKPSIGINLIYFYDVLDRTERRGFYKEGEVINILFGDNIVETPFDFFCTSKPKLKTLYNKSI